MMSKKMSPYHWVHCSDIEEKSTRGELRKDLSIPTSWKIPKNWKNPVNDFAK